MEEARQPESLSSCRNVSDVAYYARSKVELCIQNYMSLDVTAKYLEKTHRISKSVTRIVWERLREENPDFFNHFEMRCQMALQMRMFIDVLTQQAVGMLENGFLDICDASPSVKTLLRQQHPERVHILETLASKKKLSSASLVALPYANGPSGESFANCSAVAQTQTLYNQQEQVLNPAGFSMPNPNGPSGESLTNFVAQTHILYNQQDQVLNPASFAMPNPNGPILVQSQNPYDQQELVINPASFAMPPNPSGPSASAAQWQVPMQLNQHLYPSSLALSDSNGISVTQLPIPYDQQEPQDQHLYTTKLPWPYADGPSVTQLQIPSNQQDQHLYTTSLPLPTANGPSMAQLPIPNNQQNQPYQDPLPTYNDLISPTFAPADIDNWNQLLDPAAFGDLATLPPLPRADTTIPWPSPDDLAYTATLPEEDYYSTFDLGGDIGHNGPSLLDADTIIAGMDFNEQQQHQPHLQQQQQQNVQVQGSNGLVNGESNGELLPNNFGITHTSVDHQKQQAGGGVQRHNPESEALNNPDIGYIGHNGVSDSYIESAAQIVTQPGEQTQHQNGYYQPQQNSGGRRSNNGMVNGESSDHQFCNNHSKRMCTSVDEQQQAGRVKRHHPESEALNNPNSGTQTTGVEQQISPEAIATTRFLKEWELYESEETRQ